LWELALAKKGLKERHQKKQDTGVGTNTPVIRQKFVIRFNAGNNCRKPFYAEKSDFGKFQAQKA